MPTIIAELLTANQQEYAKAIADYNKAIELDPKYATSLQ
jgi:tetratricopeptide (TPR) repeat protein